MLKVSKKMVLLSAICAAFVGLVTTTGSISQEADPQSDAKTVARQWAPPDAPLTEVETLQPENRKLLVEHIDHHLAFGTLW